MPPRCARSSGAARSTSRSATPPRSATSARHVVATLPGEGTIASERVLGVVTGTRRAVCARRVAGGLLAPAAQARLAAVRGLTAGARGDLLGTLRERVPGAPAGALADAREQRDGGAPSGFGGCHGVAGMGGGMGAPAGVTAPGEARALPQCRGIARVPPMFAARGNVWALDRARRVGRHVSVLALCAVGIGVGLATPAQADRIGDTRAEANRVWEQIQSDGERLEA